MSISMIATLILIQTHTNVPTWITSNNQILNKNPIQNHTHYNPLNPFSYFRKKLFILFIHAYNNNVQIVIQLYCQIISYVFI